MTTLGNSKIRLSFYALSLMILIVMFSQKFQPVDHFILFSDYWHFFFIGIFAATIANATGAGGGIVFLPAFSLLGMTTEQAIATSFAIQCFGMTSGALAWLGLARSENNQAKHRWHSFNHVLLLAAPSSLIGLLATQQFLIHPPFNVHHFFSLFSIIVGALIFFRALRYNQSAESKDPSLTGLSQVTIVISCLMGGMITAWLSIGVGEILAITLLMLGYNVRYAIAAAVCVSSVTVLAAIFFYIPIDNTINYAVLLFAAPAALIGGFIARHLAVMVSFLKLKIVLSLWIVISGFVYLYLN